MATEVHEAPGAGEHGGGGVEMPRPNVWPIVLSLGLLLMAAGVATSRGFIPVGAVLFLVGLVGWIGELLPGRGHVHEPAAAARPQPITGIPGTVEQLLPGMPGHRLRLPEEIHPISAGVKGGIVGGAAMILPAIGYGLVAKGSIWFPINLLAGTVLPGVEQMSEGQLKDFHPTLFGVALAMHVLGSLGLGLMYGVLLPALPPIPSPLSWGGLLMPLLWTGVSFGLMGAVNPALQERASWPWFIVSQFVFGVTAAGTFLRLRRLGPVPAGLLAGAAGGLLMPLPAVLWSLANRHGIWYPVNLLAGVAVPGLENQPVAELERFHAHWLAMGLAIHVAFSLAFGVLYAVLLPKLWPIPAPMATGGLLLPLLWTGASYGLMGVLNPELEKMVNWFWFVVSQFVFGVAAAIIVVNSEKIHIPPAGRGPVPTTR
jgi:hypothetical protein